MKLKKLLSVLLATVMCATVMTGCGDEPVNNTESTVETSEVSTEASTETVADGEKVWEFMSGDPVTLTVYPGGANAKSGLIEGTIADWLLENYNIKLEIWPYSAEKTVSILTSGDLPDIMYFTSPTDVESAILGDMLVNLEEHVAEMPHVKDNEKLQVSLNYMREFRSADTGEVYVMPTTIGEASSTGVDTGKTAMKLYWDTYQAIGCPEIKTLEDTVQVFKDMQAVRPVAEDGTPVYALRLYYGRNKTLEDTTRSFYSLYGYQTNGLKYLVETDMVNATNKSILDDDSMYKRGVKWINTLMREGLVDPDSINTDRGTAYKAVRAGYALAAVEDATGFPGEGFYYGFIDDMDIYYKTSTTFAGSQYIGIGANTENLEAAVCFLDMLSDIDAVMQFTEDPEGELYEIVDGKPALTKAYAVSLAADGGASFKFSNGEDISYINLASVINLGEETSYGTKGKVTVWPEAVAITDTLPIYDEWRQDMGYNSWIDLLNDNDALHTSSDFDDVTSFLSTPSDDMALIISSLQTTVIDYTWKLYYAESDEQFESIWKEMVETCNKLGAADIIKWYMDDYAKAKEIKDGLLVVK